MVDIWFTVWFLHHRTKGKRKAASAPSSPRPVRQRREQIVFDWSLDCVDFCYIVIDSIQDMKDLLLEDFYDTNYALLD